MKEELGQALKDIWNCLTKWEVRFQRQYGCLWDEVGKTFDEYLNCGLLADGYWTDGVFTSFGVVDLKAIEEAFAERVLAQLHKRELITDDDVAQILSQDHTGFGVWLGDPFHDTESKQFVARLRSSQYKMTSLPIPPGTVQPTSLTLWSSWQRFPVIYRRPMINHKVLRTILL